MYLPLKSEEIQERKVLAYDNQKRLVCDTLYKKVNEPNGTSAFRLYQKHNYTYTLSDTIPTEVEEFRFNTTSQEFLQTYKFVYQNHLYSEKQTPKASITTQADAPSDVIFQITPPEYTTGLKGYKFLLIILYKMNYIPIHISHYTISLVEFISIALCLYTKKIILAIAAILFSRQ